MSTQANNDKKPEYVDQPWEILSQEQIFAVEPWIRIIREEVRLPNGVESDYYVDTGIENNVNVIAVTPENEVLLCRQYKHPIRKVSLETIGGIVEAGEDPDAAAKRELEEETGYQTGKWTKLAKLHANAGNTVTQCHVYLAQDVKPTGMQKLDEKEFAEVVRVPINEIPAMLGKEIKDSPRITAVTLALQKLGVFPK